MLDEVAQRIYRCSLPGSVQGWDAWSFEQLNLGKDVSAHSRRVRLDDL